MIKYFAYTHGKYANGKDGKYPKPELKKDFLCLFAEAPTDAEKAEICNDFKFSPKCFMNYEKEARSMRYSMKPLVFVLLDYYAENKQIKRAHILFTMKKNVLVVTVPHRSKYHAELFNILVDRIKKEKKDKNQLAYFLYYFLYEDARENYDVLDEIENRIFAIEENVKISNTSPDLIDNIVKLKRKCFRMSKHLWASAKLIFTIKRGLTPLTLDRELLYLMDDVYDTFVHQTDLLTTEREILTDLLEIYATNINNKLTVISNELSVIMKKLTAFTIIIMIPTLITSFYGMNFRHMPELESPYGYIGIILLMIITSGLIYSYFHRKDWV